MIFPGENASKRYDTALRAFLAREEVKTALGDFAKLLLGSHSLRKGATNHGAWRASSWRSCRGQWDIGDTLKRYFKEHQAGDGLVARIVAGLDIYHTTFAALPPHFVGKIPRQLDNAILAQFGSTNPLCKDSAHPGAKVVLRMLYASLVHHHDAIVEKLPSTHPLMSTPLFMATPTARAQVEKLLGPEIGLRGDNQKLDGSLTSSGLPPHTVYMQQAAKYHAEAMQRSDEAQQEREELRENQHKMQDRQKEIYNVLCEHTELFAKLGTHGTAVVGPEALGQAFLRVLESRGVTFSSSTGGQTPAKILLLRLLHILRRGQLLR
jgi:hypothetical protein